MILTHTAVYIGQVTQALTALIGAGATFRIAYSLLQAKGEGESVAKAMEKSKKVLYAACVGIGVSELLGKFQSYFIQTDSAKPKYIASLVENILKDMVNVFLVLEATIIIYRLIMEGIKLQAAEGEEKGTHKKNMKSIMGIGILLVSVTSLLPVIFNYFK